MCVTLPSIAPRVLLLGTNTFFQANRGDLPQISTTPQPTTTIVTTSSHDQYQPSPSLRATRQKEHTPTMPELRQRQTTASSGPNRDTNTPTPQPSRHTSNEDRGISVLDIIRVLVTLVIASCGLSYYVTNSESVLWGYRPWYTRWPVLKSYMVSEAAHPTSSIEATNLKQTHN